MEKFQGVYVVMVTPFDREGKIDCDGIRKNVDWWISEGVHGIIPLGSTGEFASLQDDERRQVAETVMEAVDDRVPVLIGTTAETTDRAISYSLEAQELGAAGVMILPSYYCKPNQEEMYIHFRRIAEAVDLPIMLYNNPFSSGVTLEAETVVRLAVDLPNIAYIKESSADMRRFTQVRAEAGDHITLFCGWEDLAYESFAMGAEGWVSVIANIAPRLSVELYQLVAINRNFDAGWDLYKRMLPMMRFLEYSGKLQQTLKYGLDRQGLCGGLVRAPRLPLTPGERARVDGLLAGPGIE